MKQASGLVEDEDEINEVRKCAKAANKTFSTLRRVVTRKGRTSMALGTQFLVSWDGDGKVTDVNQLRNQSRGDVNGEDGVEKRVNVNRAFLNRVLDLQGEILQCYFSGSRQTWRRVGGGFLHRNL